MKLLIGIPTRGTVTTDWALSLATLAKPSGMTVDMRQIHGAPIDHMRNDLVRAAILEGYDYLFMNDDDTCVPERGLLQLLSRKLDVVSGLYARRYLPIEPVMYVETETHRERITDYAIGELLTVDYTGAGCLLLSKKVLAAVSYPWFKWTAHDTSLPNKDRFSEDMFFCRRAREAGFAVHVDTSVRCLHMGPGKAEIGGVFVPASGITDSVAYGTGQITREQVKAL